MPRKVKGEALYLQRRDNYVFHFECRSYFKVLPLEMQLLYGKYALTLPRFGLNVWGGIDVTMPDLDHMIKLANDKGLPDAWFLIYFYGSDANWEHFQELWQGLPEVVHIPLVESGIYSGIAV